MLSLISAANVRPSLVVTVTVPLRTLKRPEIVFPSAFSKLSSSLIFS